MTIVIDSAGSDHSLAARLVEPSSISSDTLTVIRTHGRRLTKLMKRDGSLQGYDAARTFDMFSVSVTGLPKIYRLLETLSRRSDCAVVRGAIAEPDHVQRVRRLLHPDPRTGEAATLRDVARSWLALDVEGIEPAPGISPSDLGACAEAARLHLPTPFSSATCIAQATAGHGLKPDSRLRFWFWLSRPSSGQELKQWFRESPADPAIFGAAQIIYTAVPAFEPGIRDHLPRRLIWLSGNSDVVSVAAPAAPVRRPAQHRRWQTPTSTPSQRYGFAALRGAAARVSVAPINSRHATALREAQSLARFVAAGVLSEVDMRTTLGFALVQAGKSKPEADAIVDWALVHAASASLPAVVSG